MNVLVNKCGCCLATDVPLSDQLLKCTDETAATLRDEKIINLLEKLFIDIRFNVSVNLCEHCQSLVQNAIKLKRMLQTNQQVYENYVKMMTLGYGLIQNTQFVILVNKKGAAEAPTLGDRTNENDEAETHHLEPEIEVMTDDEENLPNAKTETEPRPARKRRKISKNKTETAAAAAVANEHECAQCEQTFSRRTDLREHKKTHKDDNFGCKLCECVFKRLCDLRRHETGHQDNRIHKCKHCDLSFKFVANLTKHEKKKHPENKLHRCKFCKSSFASSKQLIEHSASHDNAQQFTFVDVKPVLLATDDEPMDAERAVADVAAATAAVPNEKKSKSFTCTVCDASFTVQTSLKAHERTHTGEKPFVCKYCGARFAVSSSLNRHKRGHEGVKPYRCKFCEASFSDSSCLKAHERTHTGERPYKCLHCGKQFTTSGNLQKHEKRKHADGDNDDDDPLNCEKNNAGSAETHQVFITNIKQEKCDSVEDDR